MSPGQQNLSMGACNAKSVRMERERGTVVSAWILYVSHGKADLTAACIMQETVYRINSTEPMNAKCSVGEATYSCPTWVYFRTCKNLYADSMFHLLHLTFPEDLKSLIPTWSPLMLRLGTSEVTSSVQPGWLYLAPPEGTKNKLLHELLSSMYYNPEFPWKPKIPLLNFFI